MHITALFYLMLRATNNFQDLEPNVTAWLMHTL